LSNYVQNVNTWDYFRISNILDLDLIVSHILYLMADRSHSKNFGGPCEVDINS